MLIHACRANDGLREDAGGRAAALEQALRALRNLPAQGPAAASAALQARVVPALADAAAQLHAAAADVTDGGDSPATQQPLLLCCSLAAQALANYAASGSQGAEQVRQRGLSSLRDLVAAGAELPTSLHAPPLVLVPQVWACWQQRPDLLLKQLQSPQGARLLRCQLC